MIQVKRRDYPATIRRNRATGEDETIPARFRCSYLFKGMEIAHYSSTSDTIWLRTDCIGCDFSKDYYDRALSSEFAEAYRYLFAMLGADKTTKFSEYTYA